MLISERLIRLLVLDVCNLRPLVSSFYVLGLSVCSCIQQSLKFSRVSTFLYMCLSLNVNLRVLPCSTLPLYVLLLSVTPRPCLICHTSSPV